VKALNTIFDSLRKYFEAGGRLEKLKPLFDATETFFFIPGDVTKEGPHIRDSLDLKRYMSIVIIAILPTFFWGIYNTGYQSIASTGSHVSFLTAIFKGLEIVLPMVIVSYGVGFFWETIFASVRKHNISEGFLVTGLLFPLILPPTISLWQVALGISFGVVIGKEIFGGTGKNFMNPALTGRAFLFFSYPVSMSGDSIWTVTKGTGAHVVDAISGATPLSLSALSGPGMDISSSLTHAGYSMMKLFTGLYPGCVGETSTLLCLVGAVILVVTGVANYRIILGGVMGLLGIGLLLNLFAGDGHSPWFSLNPVYHLVMGGFAFGIIYMATDPVSAPGMNSSRWIYGILIGALTMAIRVFNPAYPEGVMLAILFMNLLSPVIDHFVVDFRLTKRMPNV